MSEFTKFYFKKEPKKEIYLDCNKLLVYQFMN